MAKLYGKWTGLIAGNVSEMTVIVDAVRAETKKSSRLGWREISRQCGKAYREERKRLIETEILTDYDIDSYPEYLSLKVSDRELFDAIGERIELFDANLNLLIFGFDNHNDPHIFSIVGNGKIQYCDIQSHGVAGSGAWAATVALDRYPYNKWKPIGECIYAVLAAKFAAESAEGVGRETELYLFTEDHPHGTGGRLGAENIEVIKGMWKALPRIPVGIADNLEKAVGVTKLAIEEFKRNRKIEKPRFVVGASLILHSTIQA
jgi:hypothetical protein